MKAIRLDSPEGQEYMKNVRDSKRMIHADKVGMTTAELIERLKEMDPEGTAYVSVGKNGAFDIDMLPGYYDGRLWLPVYDEVEMTWGNTPVIHRDLKGMVSESGGRHVFFRVIDRGEGGNIWEFAVDGFLFEFSFKGLRGDYKVWSRDGGERIENETKIYERNVFKEIKDALQWQIDHHEQPIYSEEYTKKRMEETGKSIEDFQLKTLYGLKSLDQEVIISGEELTQDFLDSLDADTFWNRVKERTNLGEKLW